MIFDLVSRQ